MSIRRADIDDATAIYEVELDCFSVPWSEREILRDLTVNDKAMYFVAQEDGEIVAYAGIWLVADEGQITNVAVRQAYRRSGYGRMLVRRMIKEAFKSGMSEIFLEVRISNLAAIDLYRRLGFTVKGIRKGYYEDPVEDAYIMSLGKEEP